ncbi:MAG: hypothetical protein R3A51_13290 [Nannocystaceae bacterium]|nr:hypothetical protein [Myxococcales bacterium]
MNEQRRPRRSPIALTLKAIGYLTDPKSPPGKLFNAWERAATGLMERLGRDERYLRVVGAAMNEGFRQHARAREELTRWVHAFGLPAQADVDRVEQQLARARGQLEALEAQLEVIASRLEQEPKDRNKVDDARP